MSEFKLGKSPAVHDSRTLRYADYFNATESAPESAHWGHGLPYAMLGNDKYGDCVEAAYAHQVQVWNDRTGAGFVPTDAETLGAYTALTGFNPNDPNSDQGTDMLAALKYWQKTGIAGHKLFAYATLDVKNTDETRESVAWYGGANIGVQLPISAQAQVGKQWTVTSGPDAQAGSWGGHCIPIVGFDQNQLWVITWGALQSMTWGFFTTYCDEAYVLLSKEWVAASGESPSKLAWGTLLADMANL